MVSTNEPNSDTEAMTAEPMATPLVMALVVLPTASRLTMTRSASPVNSPDISATPGGVVRDGPEAVLGDDHAGRREHADAGQGDEVEGELDVAVGQDDRDGDGHGDGQDGPHRRLEADGDAGQDRRGRARAGRLGDLPHRAALGRGEVLGDLAGHEGRGPRR